MQDTEHLIRDIHENSVIVDAHLDLCMFLRQERQKGRRRVIESDYLDDIRRGGINVIVSAIFTDETSISGSALSQACDQIACLYAEMEESPGLFRLCTTYEQVTDTVKSGMLAILLSFEGAEPLGTNPGLLPLFHKLGVRGLGLAHARRNLACDGARYTETSRSAGCGLTELGAEFIRTADELGMLIDVTHLNDAGTEDVLSIARGPVIASHSNCRALNPTMRNLPDSLISAIANTGGVIGINGCSAIVGDTEDTANLSVMADHVDHLVQVGGIDHVGLGFDLAERIMPDSSIVVNGRAVRVYDVVGGYSALPALTGELLRRGYTGEMIDKLYGGNFLRVYREVLR